VDLARVLVIANRTADSPQLRAALLQRRERGPIAVTLLVPAAWEILAPGGDVQSGQRRLDAAVRGLEENGLEVDAPSATRIPSPLCATRGARGASTS
jgi:hypothetical protein